MNIPLFQLYWFFNKTLPLGLKGPCSTNAPSPTDEQPGPAIKNKKKINKTFCTQIKKSKFE